MITPFSINKHHLLMLVFILLFSTNLDHLIDGARYIKYAITPIIFLLWITNHLRAKKNLNPTDTALLLITGWTAISSIWGDTVYGLQDTFFIATYTLPFILLKDQSIPIKRIFICYTLFFCTTLINRQTSTISVLESSTIAEGSAAFAFGAFSIYFLIERKHLLFIISILLLIISLKRIALLGVIACIISLTLPTKGKKIISTPWFIILANSSVIATLYLFSSDFFSNVILEVTGKSPNAISMGRYVFYNQIFENIQLDSLSLFFGKGGGVAYTVISHDYYGPTKKINAHSDTLKIFYELGIICFLIFFYKISSKRNFYSGVFILYMTTLFTTDNILIYPEIMLLILYISHQLNNKQAIKMNTTP